MTATYAITEEHCLHECICPVFVKTEDGTCMAGCIHDTRKHPLPATAAPDAPQGEPEVEDSFRIYRSEWNSLESMFDESGCEDGLRILYQISTEERDIAVYTASLLAAAREQWEKEDHVWMTSEEEEKRIRSEVLAEIAIRIDRLEGWRTPDGRMYLVKDVEAVIDESGKKAAIDQIRADAINGCRKIVGDRVIYGKCPFNGDCGQCFLCNNTGGCIISTDEEIHTQVTGAYRNGLVDGQAKAAKENESINARILADAAEQGRDVTLQELSTVLDAYVLATWNHQVSLEDLRTWLNVTLNNSNVPLKDRGYMSNTYRVPLKFKDDASTGGNT